MKKQRRLWAVLFAVAFATTANSADIKHVLLSPSFSSGTYDADTETITDVTATFRLDIGATQLAWYATFDPPQSGRLLVNGPNSIPFDIFDRAMKPRNVLLDEATAVSVSDVLSGIMPEPARFNLPTAVRNFAFVVLPGGFAPAGRYTAQASVSLWQGPFKSGAFLGSATFYASVTVSDILELSVVPVGAPFDFTSRHAVFDFGFLSAGNVRSADLVVRANVKYGVTLSSAHGGILRYTNPADSSTVPYELRINGNPLTLVPGVAVPVVLLADSTTSEGRRFRLDAEILPFDFPTEGSYSDVLTFSIVKN